MQLSVKHRQLTAHIISAGIWRSHLNFQADVYMNAVFPNDAEIRERSRVMSIDFFFVDAP